MTGYTIVRRAKKKTGFDWWLDNDGPLPFKTTDRMEVSGIRNGTAPQIASRLKQKLAQTRQSDSMNIPAYTVVVEFGRPLSKIGKR